MLFRSSISNTNFVFDSNGIPFVQILNIVIVIVNPNFIVSVANTPRLLKINIVLVLVLFFEKGDVMCSVETNNSFEFVVQQRPIRQHFLHIYLLRNHLKNIKN